MGRINRIHLYLRDFHNATQILPKDHPHFYGVLLGLHEKGFEVFREETDSCYRWLIVDVVRNGEVVRVLESNYGSILGSVVDFLLTASAECDAYLVESLTEEYDGTYTCMCTRSNKVRIVRYHESAVCYSTEIPAEFATSVIRCLVNLDMEVKTK